MSEITETHAAWVPPPFPPQGRLPGRALQVGQNCHQQNIVGFIIVLNGISNIEMSSL